MKRTIVGWILAIGALLTLGQASAQETVAELRIDLPAGAAQPVSIEPGERRIVLELPRGSGFPMDFAASSAGLLRDGEVTPLGDGRVRLELELARGVLERIDYGENAVVLRLVSQGGSMTLDAVQDGYRLGPDDKITITVHNQPQLTSTLSVTDEGTLVAPMVDEMVVEGLTPREVAVRLADLLGRDFLVDPQVDVAVEEYRSQWVMVTGEVRLPARVYLRGGTRLSEVVSEAGSFTEYSGEVITVSRRRGDSDIYDAMRIDRQKFETGETDPVLRHGDIVEVAEAAYCYIQGEVRNPNRLRVDRGMTLLKAIAQVGGLTEWANKKAVKVLYDSGEGQTEVKAFNLKRILEGKEQDPFIRGGEKIVVERRYF